MFDRDRAKRIQDDMLRALKAVEDQHGVKFEIGRTAIGDTIQMSVECSRIGPGGRAFNKELLDFKQFADGYGLKPEDLGRTFVVRGTPYEIVGLNIAAPKYPILGKCKASGRIYRFPAQLVATALGAQT